MVIGFSENGINVIVKHVQHVEIIWAFCLPGGVFKIFIGGTEKITGLSFARGKDQYPG